MIRRRHYSRKPKSRKEDFYKYQPKRPRKLQEEHSEDNDNDDSTSSTTAEYEQHSCSNTSPRKFGEMGSFKLDSSKKTIRKKVMYKLLKTPLSLQSRSFSISLELEGPGEARGTEGEGISKVSKFGKCGGIELEMAEGKVKNDGDGKDRNNHGSGDSEFFRKEGEVILALPGHTDESFGVRVRGEVVKTSLCLDLEPTDFFFHNPKTMNPPLSLQLKNPDFT